jgi:hypothetical protein
MHPRCGREFDSMTRLRIKARNIGSIAALSTSHRMSFTGVTGVSPLIQRLSDTLCRAIAEKDAVR